MKRSLFCLLPCLILCLWLHPGPSAISGKPKAQLRALSRQAQPVPGRYSVPAVRADLDFGRMPLHFIANQGQLDGRVAYYVQGRDKTVYFAKDGLTIALTYGKEGGEKEVLGRAGDNESARFGEVSRGLEKQGRGVADEEETGFKRWVVRLDFADANSDVKPLGVEKSEAVISYFKGKPDEWRTGLPTFSKIIYPDLWPGIDLVYSGTTDRLKYEFIVQPGADASVIRLAYSGVSGVSLADDGRLEVSTPLGDFSDDIPVAFQEIDGRRVNVPLAYILDSWASGEAEGVLARAEENERVGMSVAPDQKFGYGFQVGEYDRSRPLVLDPAIIVYCGYVGGSGDDYGRGIAVDSSGNAYITGYTLSTQTSFPVAVGPDLTHNSGNDAFVAKVDPSDGSLVYCGYIGGSASDYGLGIVLDPLGNAYVTGYTYSSESSFPVLVGPGLIHKGMADVFVAKVNASGTALSYCGYIGGSGEDLGFGIAFDVSGNAYVTGLTESTELSFPVQGGPDQTHNGSADAFVAKLNPAGSSLVYCGYIGGLSGDYGRGIAVDIFGNAYVAGYTYSDESTFPVAGGPDLTHNGLTDAFVAKVDASGTGLSYCGYIGGSAEDEGRGIALDFARNAYICGYTVSSQASFPAAVGPDLTHNGGVDAFVAKVNSSGSALSYCGYIGGSGGDEGLGVSVDIAGNAFVTGSTYSDQSTFPVREGPDLTHNGGQDAFVAKVDASGTALAFCGYIGGSGFDYGEGIALDGPGNAHIVGWTDSDQSTFPVSIGPDLTHNGGYDVFVVKVFEDPIWRPRHAVGDFDGDRTDEAAVDFGAAGIYLYDGGAWTQLSTSDPESLVAADVDGDGADELLADLGATGLWLWNAGAWSQLSGVDVEGLAAGDVDDDSTDEVVGDFGAVGMWLYNGGTWSQLSGANADYVAVAELGGSVGEEVVGDFGILGLWARSGGIWTQLSGANADYITFGNTDGLVGKELIGDFGSIGLWVWSIWSGWSQLSGVNADFMVAMQADGDAQKELVCDFGVVGMWFWDSGTWEQNSGENAEYMIIMDVDNDGVDEGAVDFGPLGLWLGSTSSGWTQLSGVNPEYLIAGDMDGDFDDEFLADFGSLGLWLWNAGAWSQVSANDPE